MFKIIKELVRQTKSYVNRDEPALLTFLFHSIFKNEEEFQHKLIDPQQYVTLDVYRWFIEYFLDAGYKFISPEDLKDLSPEGKYILSTFDDGYFNNTYVLPLLEEYKTPAVFFITTDNVINQECFWWDVVFRELSKQGLERKAISKEQGKLKSFKHPELVIELKKRFGEDCFVPQGELDRPLTINELKDFSKHEYVHIGNHTKNHYILDKYTYAQQAEQITGCSQSLEDILGSKSEIIAYPNGNYNEDTLRASADFDFGITVKKRKNFLPIDNPLELGRHVLWGNKSLKRQGDIFRSNW
ncbi:polysaccharide deacetylase family protein [Lentisphaera profundi]|uniref:Polysaccharide deacetylase family protein n=1 Tax=Lentisphaera profundi TaxID=1658616 RepID=A0ABY7VRK3_9BACT|nr:polysaccharide deacetylase family protein [Lentisphaera profundi]WDE95858.1 polysaccharide deacetylase family protein [Lentisphaera profundi]